MTTARKNRDCDAAHPYVRLARRTVTNLLNGKPLPESGMEIEPEEALWSAKSACFVSIKTRSGHLRGCIGTISPVHSKLDAEIISNAVSASTKDPRFKPMTSSELCDVVFSVDVLGKPQRIRSTAELDPSKWGVIVSKGFARGVLLPALEGVDDVQTQLEIASRKAGISDPSGIVIERFSVDRYPEDEKG